MHTNALTHELRPLLGSFITLLIITAVVYPLLVTGIAQAVFPAQANGSIVSVGDHEVGSKLIGQLFAADEYFHGRPSAAGAGYDASASSGSNLGPTSDKLINGVHDKNHPESDFDGIKDRAAAFRDSNGLVADAVLPADAVTASASGLDPDVSPATAQLQIPRVAKARGVADAKIDALVEEFAVRPALGAIGEPYVRVLDLNIALDARYPRR